MHHESDQLKEELIRENSRKEDLRKSLRLCDEAKNRVQSEANRLKVEVEEMNVKVKVRERERNYACVLVCVRLIERSPVRSV